MGYYIGGLKFTDSTEASTDASTISAGLNAETHVVKTYTHSHYQNIVIPLSYQSGYDAGDDAEKLKHVKAAVLTQQRNPENATDYDTYFTEEYNAL